MLRNMIRRSGMLALVLALALAGTAPAVALDSGGRNFDGWHTVWNWVQGGLLGFSVDRSVSSGLVASIQTTGPDFMTGGSFGPDGGVVATAILLVGIATLLTRRASHPGS